MRRDHNAAVVAARKLKRKQISALSGTLNNYESHKMGCCKKYLVNACGVRDGLSGDMLALSWRNLVLTHSIVSAHGA